MWYTERQLQEIGSAPIGIPVFTANKWGEEYHVGGASPSLGAYAYAVKKLSTAVKYCQSLVNRAVVRLKASPVVNANETNLKS